MSETTRPCIKGCTHARRHVTTCEDVDCRGCLPVTVHASTSHLCERCHLRLSASLADVIPQHKLLHEAIMPSQQMHIRPQPKRGRPDYWPTESDAPRYFYPISAPPSAPQESEPVRLACLDVAQELADLMSEWVEWVCDVHDRRGPDRATTVAESEGRARWTDPPPTLEVDTAARWLRANLEWVERLEAIGDMTEDLRSLMGRAHALQPWRAQAKRIKGIPCPECHRHSLTQYGGRETVTCETTWCKTEIPQERYLIWARMYEEETA